MQIAADEPPPMECNAFFVVHGKKTCKFDELGVLLQSASERYFYFVTILTMSFLLECNFNYTS